ncbi:MAG TPA: efflux transporter outer membrane subunit [Steroidobacteraceae bacterium]
MSGVRDCMIVAGALGLAGCALGLGGCAVGPSYHTPDVHVPAHYAPVPAAGSAPANSGASTAPAASIDLATWWRALRDPELESLVDRAVKANPDVLIALDRLQAARTFEIAVLGSALPDAEASAGAGRGTGSDLARGRASQSLVAADNASAVHHINVLAGFDSLWEIDLFGKYRREIQAVRADAQASAAQRNAVLVSVIADVARAYVDLRGLQVRAAVVHDAIAALQETLRIVNLRYERGITNELDVTLAARELATLQSQVAPLDAAASAAQYTIATLLGQYPETLVAELTPVRMIPSVPGRVDGGMPVDLLRRRPEVLQAERQLAAATARIGVATANLFPQIGVTGAIGFQQQGFGTTPQVGQHVWSLGPAALWPLLDFGALDAQVEAADLQTRALLVNYRRTVQNAVKEVDTNWRAFTAQQDRLSRLGEALTASQRAVTLANERYRRGLTDFLNVVDAQRQEYDIEGQYADAQVSAAEQFIALYRSFGGGWQNYQKLPAPHFPEPAVVAAFHRVLSRSDPLK